MPRMSASKELGRPAAPPPRARAKKSAPPPDRLSARTLFFRRVKRSLRPGLWVLALLLVLAVLPGLFRSMPALEPAASPVGGIRHGFAELAALAGFRVSAIDVTGVETVPVPVILAALGVKTGDPILGYSLAALQARVEQLGPVQSATVERVLPGTLIVNVTERNAFAIWQEPGIGGAPKFVLIDKQGDVIAGQDAAAAKRRDPALLLLAGDGAPENAATLLTELHAAPAVLSRVVAAERIDGLRWNLTLADQTLVKLPADDEPRAIAQLASLQAGMGLLDRPVEVIDLRLPGRLIVRPYPAATPPPAAGKAGHS